MLYFLQRELSSFFGGDVCLEIYPDHRCQANLSTWWMFFFDCWRICPTAILRKYLGPTASDLMKELTLRRSEDTVSQLCWSLVPATFMMVFVCESSYLSTIT